MEMESIVQRILDRPGPVRLVAIDGPGGAGKSTFAAKLASAAGGAPVISTDDFASWDNPVEWWPRLRDQVIDPLMSGKPARYQRYDWETLSLEEWRVVDLAPIVIIEGVSSGRTDWADDLAFLIWIETPRDVRLARGLERDGLSALGQWETWMAAEDSHYQANPTRRRADVEVCGTA